MLNVYTQTHTHKSKVIKKKNNDVNYDKKFFLFNEIVSSMVVQQRKKGRNLLRNFIHRIHRRMICRRFRLEPEIS